MPWTCRLPEDAVKKARAPALRRLLIADSVGLGQPVGTNLLEELLLPPGRQKALVVCPASLKGEVWVRDSPAPPIAAPSSAWRNWDGRPLEPTIWRLRREPDRLKPQFSATTRRTAPRPGYAQSSSTAAGSGTAKPRASCFPPRPINNDLTTLSTIFRLVTQAVRTTSARPASATGRRLPSARRVVPDAGTRPRAWRSNLLEYVLVPPPGRTSGGVPERPPSRPPLQFPDRRPHTVGYDSGALRRPVRRQSSRHRAISLAPYQLEAYRKKSPSGTRMSPMEGRELSLFGIFRRVPKRLDPASNAFRLSLRRGADL